MSLETSQESFEPAEDFDLFGEETGAEAQSEEQQTGDTNPEAAPEGETKGEEKPQTVKLKYNGQEVEKTLDEVMELAQKGMNYDHVKGKLDAAEKAAPAAAVLKKFADAAGMSLEEYMQQAEGQLNAKAVKELTDKGMPEQEAKELLELRAKSKAADEQSAKAKKQQDDQALWMDFVKQYPEVAKSGVIEPEVAKNIQAGMTPVQAQMAYENKQLKQQLAALQAGQNNRKAAPGSAAGTAGNAQEDAFLKAFMSD